MSMLFRIILFLVQLIGEINSVSGFSSHLLLLLNTQTSRETFCMKAMHSLKNAESSSSLYSTNCNCESKVNNRNLQTSAPHSRNTLLAATLAVTVATTAACNILITATPANAYMPTDYASDTVQAAIQELKSASGNADATFKAYENIAGIITEGKGVGGMVNYKGVQLDRGYVADEDTSIYNPGLTLLTESEKERLVVAVIEARHNGLSQNQWTDNNEFAFDFLREKLDPFHLVELSGYLKFAPFFAGILYVAVLAVQQFARDVFQIAYLLGAAAFFLPIVALIAAGV